MTGRAREIFDRVVDVHPGERAGLLDALCQRDTTIRREVESLLKAAEDAGTFLQTPACDLSAVAPTRTPGVGDRVGRYVIEGVLGSGGMGAVFRARQDEPSRTVAIKVIRGGLPDAALRRRFQQEAKVLGSLQHPGIAQVYEAGTQGAGADAMPYLAMEYVPAATSITIHADQRGLSIDARLTLFCKVCDAVQHAHQRGVIHRDLKPGNILMPGGDAPAEPKIIDFGIARFAGPTRDEQTQHTTVGQLVGTLRYMSPEQFGDTPDDVDTRSDVYSLGVILFELLTGRVPYDIRSSSLLHMPRIVREAPPIRPSQVNALLAGDLETIVLKCLEKDRQRRYQSAGELAADVRRFLDHRPILARPPSTMYQVRMFARRNLPLVVASIIAAAALIAGAGATAWQAIAATHQRNLARQAERDAVAQRQEALWQSYVANIGAADAFLRAGDTPAALDRLEAATPELRGWEWGLLRARSDQSERTWRGPRHQGILDARQSPDGATWAFITTDHQLLITAPDFSVLAATSVPENSGLPFDHYTLAFSPDGSKLATGHFNTIILRDARTAVELQRLEIQGSWSNLSGAFSPSGDRLVVAGRDGNIWLWDLARNAVAAKRIMGPSDRAGFAGAAFLGDGSRILASTYKEVAILDGWTLERVGGLAWPEDYPPTEFSAVAISPDQRSAAVGAGFDILVYNLASQAPPSVLRGHTQRITTLNFSADNRLLVTGSMDQTLRVWDVVSGALVDTLRGHRAYPEKARFSTDPARCYSVGLDRSFKLWQVGASRESWSVALPRRAAAVDFSQDSSLAIAGGDLGYRIDPRLRRVSIYTDADGKQLRYVWGASADGEIIVATTPSSAAIIAGRTGKILHVLEAPIRPDDAALYGRATFSPDRSLVAGLHARGGISVWDTSSGLKLWSVEQNSDGIARPFFSPDGRQMLCGNPYDTLVAWESRTGRELYRIDLAGTGLRGVIAAALSPDGSRLAIGGSPGVALVLDARTHALVATLRGMDPAVWAIAFSPDGKRIATGSQDRRVRVWDAATGTLLLTLEGHTSTVMGVVWSPDGTTLLSTGHAGALCMWQTPPARPGEPVQR